jgi:hypothetical protein
MKPEEVLKRTEPYNYIYVLLEHYRQVGRQIYLRSAVAVLPGRHSKKITPSESGLLLRDSEELKVSDVAGKRMKHAQLAFLSACHTAVHSAKELAGRKHSYRRIISAGWISPRYCESLRTRR